MKVRFQWVRGAINATLYGDTGEVVQSVMIPEGLEVEWDIAGSEDEIAVNAMLDTSFPSVGGQELVPFEREK